jgi:hypothetical protein
MSTYGASGLMGQWLESNGAFGAVPRGPVFQAEAAYGAVPGGAVFDAETSYGAVPGGPVFDAEAAYGEDVFGALDSVSLHDELAYGAEDADLFGALDSVSLHDELAYGAEDADLFGALDSVSLHDELAYGAEDADLFGALDSVSLHDELAYGAEPAGQVYDAEMAYGEDEAVFGAFEKATAKGRIAKLYRISARIQYLVDMGKVDVAREKAKKLLTIWAKLSAMPDAQPLISAALQDEMARVSAFASGQVNNPHDAGATAIQPGVAVDPTMTAGGVSLFSTNLDALYTDVPSASSDGGYVAAPAFVPAVQVPVYPRPLYGPPPRRPLVAAARARAHALGRGSRYGEEDFGATSASSQHTYKIRRGPGKGMEIRSTLDKAEFGRCRRLANGLRTKTLMYTGNGNFKAKGGHTFSIQDAPFLAECSRVSKFADKGQSFGGSEE